MSINDHHLWHQQREEFSRDGSRTSTVTVTLPYGNRGESFPPSDPAAYTLPPHACSCPAPHHPSARFCARCGGTIRRPSAAMAWIRGAAVRPIKMAAAVVATPVFIAAFFPPGMASLIHDDVYRAHGEGWYARMWKWWWRMIYPTSLKRILQ